MSQTTAPKTPRSLPLTLRWSDALRPVPVRTVRPPAGARPIGLEAPPWLDTGDPDQPFDFTTRLHSLCADIAGRCPDFAHLDVSRLLIGFTQARNGFAHGLQARVTPLRFRDGRLVRRCGGTTYQVQRYFVNGREMLYLVTFCLPRFLDQSFDDKFITLFHELYHISPAFEGDLRRHPGRCALHTHSKRAYDAQMGAMAREYLASGADPRMHAFLRLTFAQLHHRHQRVVGVVVPRPRLLPIQIAARAD